MKRTFNDEAAGALFIREEGGAYRRASEEEILSIATATINARFSSGPALTSPAEAQEFIQLRLAPYPYEVFAVLWLDNRHRFLAFEELFRGTLDGASVHPREVVKSALAHNAGACILAHNHPSGISEPSEADRKITQRIKEALELIEVRTLDHLVAGEQVYSFAERGLL